MPKFSPLLPIGYPRPSRSGFTNLIRLINLLLFLWKSGAGEGIRTLDPNLGKFNEGLSSTYPKLRNYPILSISYLTPNLTVAEEHDINIS